MTEVDFNTRAAVHAVKAIKPTKSKGQPASLEVRLSLPLPLSVAEEVLMVDLADQAQDILFNDDGAQRMPGISAIKLERGITLRGLRVTIEGQYVIPHCEMSKWELYPFDGHNLGAVAVLVIDSPTSRTMSMFAEMINEEGVNLRLQSEQQTMDEDLTMDDADAERQTHEGSALA